MSDSTTNAPGWPGIPPRWTSSAKTGIGTSLNRSSRVWFTLSHGILNEIYFPRVDMACTRDLGLIVTDGASFFSEEKRDCKFEIVPVEPGVPAFRLVNTEVGGKYRIEKEIFADPHRNVVLQKIKFIELSSTGQPVVPRFGGGKFRLYALLAPHLGNVGSNNTAWTGDYKGVPMLYAESPSGLALALGCSVPWAKMSVGYAGRSDGWQELSRNFQLTNEYPRVENGNVAVTGEVDLSACGGEFVLALGFGNIWAEAGEQVRAALLDDYSSLFRDYVSQWRNWQKGLLALDGSGPRDVYRASTAVLRAHESKDFLGGVIASLSIPWGFNKGDEDLGGYHLVWPRDLVETAGGFLAAGAVGDAVRVLHYLETTQEADGRWPQNMWLDGRPYWNGLQMDEAAFPILLVELLRREAGGALGDLKRWWPMVRRAAAFIACNGPVTQQDRWEEDAGYSPFTLAVEVAGLLAAADVADNVGESAMASYLRELADVWNENIERWTYSTNGDLARQVGVDGYYVRIAPPESDCAASPTEGFVPIKNRPPGENLDRASHVISPDALSLVRFGLRAPDDPRIVNTIKVLDAILKAKLPQGPLWYRYNDDGYGEHADGAPFDGTGIGRPWPLLAGERAHYELAAGNVAGAEALLKTMESSTNGSRLLPEQVWDGPDIPGRELLLGKPSGSACPLVWAHSEYIKLLRSLKDGKIFDQPPQTAKRYPAEQRRAAHWEWRFNNKCRVMPAGKTLRIAVMAPATVHWSRDGWQTAQDISARSTGLGIYVADLPTSQLDAGHSIVFTMYWPEADRWEGADFGVTIQAN
ncbi:MAG: glucan 1,4-alpha-glucosidase [Acidobacteria bacterium]|nr:MAG: glucan 1,4-alpha-glucosidase [Acidobacteriota bacterium]